MCRLAEFWRWFIALLIGIVMGILGFLVDWGIENLNNFKYRHSIAAIQNSGGLRSLDLASRAVALNQISVCLNIHSVDFLFVWGIAKSPQPADMHGVNLQLLLVIRVFALCVCLIHLCLASYIHTTTWITIFHGKVDLNRDYCRWLLDTVHNLRVYQLSLCICRRKPCFFCRTSCGWKRDCRSEDIFEWHPHKRIAHGEFPWLSSQKRIHQHMRTL